ncbi:MAG: hypothetical protein K2L49_08770, partial [Muribaculaceae bacterium]|nr:hypothetical protein [Muribaculaceae bacterium]
MKDKRHKGISWHGAVDAIVDCACRFPLTVVYVLLLTGMLITDMWTAASGWDWARVRDVLVYGFSVGALLSLVIY